MINPPSHINESDWNEWVAGSGIDPKLTSLSIISISGHTPHEYLLYGLGPSERRNGGILREKWLRRFAHLFNGGWWCRIINVLTGEEDIWGCFKPYTPHIYEEKPIKYEHPPKVPTKIFALPIPLDLWKAIASRHNLTLPENIAVTPEGRAIGFWQWLINNPCIPIIITEGAKKAGIIITTEYVGIALPGIYGGYRQPKNKKGEKIGDPYLIPELSIFAHPDREIIFCFDNDNKPETIKNVRTAIAKTGLLLEQAGCKVSVITWDYLPFKGVDDLIVAKGEKYFHQLYENRISLANFNRGRKVVEIAAWKEEQKALRDITWKRLTSLTVKPWLEVCTPNLEEIKLENILERGHIYLLLAAKGTGKTNTAKSIIEQFTNIYAWFNRIALGREECHKLGLTYKDDLGTFQGFLKTGFCANSGYQFNPSRLQNNGLFFGDESDQVLGYMFESICNKNGIRPAILKAFTAQLSAAIHGEGMGLFMSADNTDIEYEFLKAIAPPGCEVRVIVNTYQPPRGEVIFDNAEKPDGSIADLMENLKNNIPCFVIDDIKNGVKGCKSIAEYIRKTQPEIADRIVEINSDTSGSETIIEYLKNINEMSKETLLLISSPSVISGISIINGHFQRGYGFFNGILTTKESSQSLVRVRGLKQLNVWAAPKGFTWAANGGLTPSAIKEYYLKNYQQNSKYLSSFDLNYDPIKDEWESPWFELFCKYAAYRNLSMTDLRQRLKESLEAEGYTIIEKEETYENLTRELQETWGKINLAEAHAVAQANILDDDQLKLLQDSNKAPTIEQKRDITKTLLLKRYGQEFIDKVTYVDKVTGETLTGYKALYLKDDGGKWYRQLKQLYYLLAPESEAIANDHKREKQQKFYGSRFAGDITWNARKRKCRTFLGIDKLITPDWTSPRDYWALAAKAKKHHTQVKETINLSVKRLTSSQIYTELMRQLGVELESQWAREKLPNGRRYKNRRITEESWELSQLFIAHQFQYRFQTEEKENPQDRRKDVLKEEETQITPPSNLYKNTGGGDQAQTSTPSSNEAQSTSYITDSKAINKEDKQSLDQFVQIDPLSSPIKENPQERMEQKNSLEETENQITPPSNLYKNTGGGDQSQTSAPYPNEPEETEGKIPPKKPTDLDNKDREEKSTPIDTLDTEEASADLGSISSTKETEETNEKIAEITSTEKGSEEKLIEIDPLDTDEAIADLADFLNMVEEAEQLAIFQEISTPSRLKRACRLLPKDKIRQIREFAIFNFKKRNSGLP